MWQPKDLILIAVSLCVLACTAAGEAGGRPLMMAVSKDAATSLYTVPVNSGRPMVLDLSGPIIWSTCDDGASHDTLECNDMDCMRAHRFHPPNCPHNGNGMPDAGNTHRCKCTAHPHNPVSGDTASGDMTRVTLSANATDGRNPLGPVAFTAVTSCAPDSLLAGLPVGAVGVAGLGRSGIAFPAQVARTQGVPKSFALCLGSRQTTGVAIFAGGPLFLFPASRPSLTELLSSGTPLRKHGESPGYYVSASRGVFVDGAQVPLEDSYAPLTVGFTEDDDDEEEGAIKSSDEDRSTTEEDAPMIFGELAQHDLYYQPVDRLLETVRSTLPELDGEADELVLDFEDLGITLGEDNIYTRQVSLFDFDRLHLGCQIPGRLHVRVYAQPRFASGFNALAQHIASTYSADGPREDDDVHEEQAEDEQEGVADDYDGPDSELPAMAAAEDDVNVDAAEAAEQTRGENDDENDEEEEFDLESALAQLDQDNIIAVVEGAQEDLMTDMPPQQEEAEGEEVEGALDETNDGEQQEEAGDEHAGAQETAQQEGEEPSVEGPDAGEESWQIVEAEEASDEPTGEAAATITDAHGKDTAPFVNGSPPAADSAAEAQQTDTEAEQAADVAGGFKEADNADGRAEQTAKIDAATAIKADVEQDAPVTEAEHAQIDAAGSANGVPQASEDIPDTTADGADVVIDYDEAFDPTSVSEEPESAEQDSADVTAATSTSTSDAPPSPKRSRSFDQVEEVNGAGEDSANDAKRPRLAETSEAEVAVQAAS